MIRLQRFLKSVGMSSLLNTCFFPAGREGRRVRRPDAQLRHVTTPSNSTHLLRRSSLHVFNQLMANAVLFSACIQRNRYHLWALVGPSLLATLLCSAWVASTQNFSLMGEMGGRVSSKWQKLERFPQNEKNLKGC